MKTIEILENDKKLKDFIEKSRKKNKENIKELNKNTGLDIEERFKLSSFCQNLQKL
jgi:hypothetical protein